jgi:hypothetical protein
MVLTTDATALQARLLGVDFLRLMPPRLLCRVAHSPAALFASKTLLFALATDKYGPLSDWVGNMRPSVAAFLDAACVVLLRNARKNHEKIAGQGMLSLFQAILTNLNPNVAHLIVPFARLLSNAAVMADFGTPRFSETLHACACLICKRLQDVPPQFYKYRFRALTILARDEPTCWAITKVVNFPVFLIGKLASTDSSLIPIHWKYFKQYIRHKTVLTHLLGQPQVMEALAALMRSDCPEIVRRFFEWGVSVSRRYAADFCTAMIPMFGQLACLLQTRKTRFKDDATIAKLIEEFAKMIVKTPGTDKATKELAKHLQLSDSKRASASPRFAKNQLKEFIDESGREV